MSGWRVHEVTIRVRGDRGVVKVDRTKLVGGVLVALSVFAAVASLGALVYSAATGERWAQGLGFAMSTVAAAADGYAWKLSAERLAIMFASLHEGRAREPGPKS